jgi:hypothetical protein
MYLCIKPNKFPKTVSEVVLSSNDTIGVITPDQVQKALIEGGVDVSKRTV